MNDKVLTLDEALNSLRRKPGLVFGSLATISERSFSLILEQAAAKFGNELTLTEEGFARALDSLSYSDSEMSQRLREYILNQLDHLSAGIDVSFLVQAGWSACISLTRDLVFESEITNFHDTLPNSKSVTLIDHPSVRPNSRTLPIYKLLGNLRSREDGHTLVLSEAELLVRKNQWRQMLGSCADYLQGGPLLFVGTGSEVDFTRELLGNLSAMPSPAPNSLLFLNDDPTLQDPTVRHLCNTFSSVKIVDSTVREFAKAIKELKPAQGRLDLSITVDSDDKAVFSAFANIVSYVPKGEIDDESFKNHRLALVDSLFKPNAVDWDPYLCGLDLERDCCNELMQGINAAIDSAHAGVKNHVIVRGEAGVGKTTLMKRVAVNLSRDDVVVFWARRAPMENWLRAYRDLAGKIAEAAKADGGTSKYVVMVDDPWSLRLDPAELVSCFEKLLVPLTFVFGLRNTEYFNQGGFSYNLPFRAEVDVEVPTVLSDNDMGRLSEMLVRIGAVSSIDDANQLIKTVPSKNTEDILCSLWYLVPETRGKLSESLKDEYHRLGAFNNSIAEFAEEAHAISGEAAQHAYEYVTVTSKFHIGLPMEVLVRALKVSYEDFIDMAVGGKPLWGLIYDEEDIENQTVLYRTRNEVVTKVLLELVNGGVGHAGEFRVLKALLQSCDIGSNLYRQFAIEVLVRSSKELGKFLTYEQGLELYQVAQEALPYEDRLLSHHKGIWIQRQGKDYKKAYRQFESALDTQQYPGAEREIHQEHIHTSMAATVVSLIEQGEQSADKGFELVKDHLHQATNPKIFSAHTGHVSARLLFQMAQQQEKNGGGKISMSSFSEALKEVEKTLQSIGPYLKKKGAKSEKSIELLKALQKQILEAISDDDKLERLAYELFAESKIQVGFELLLRKQFSNAQLSDKGTAYNNVKEHIEKVLRHIGKTLEIPSVELLAIRADLLVRWRLQKPRGPVNWELLRDDLQVVVADAVYRDNPLKTFYLAVALYHLGSIEQATAIFANLRRMQAVGLSPKDVRCYFVGAEGYAKRFQCNINSRHERSYAEISELQTDVQVAGYKKQAVNHVYIGFCLNGPVALYDKPDDQDLLMA